MLQFVTENVKLNVLHHKDRNTTSHLNFHFYDMTFLVRTNMLTMAQKMSWAGLAIRIRLHFDYIHIVLEHNINFPLTKLVK